MKYLIINIYDYIFKKIFMPGIDRFLSKSLETVIKKNVDQKIEYKMKRLMFEKYGISIRQSIE
jgi:hypothetical protein